MSDDSSGIPLVEETDNSETRTDSNERGNGTLEIHERCDRMPEA
jgi:hypothetical protein